MSSPQPRRKSVALTFRGFAVSVEELVALAGATPSRFGSLGEPVKLGVQTRLNRSYVIFSKEFESGFELNSMIPALLAELGGTDRICQLRDQVRPEFLEIHFDLPVMTADESQDGWLQETTIADAFRLGASLSFAYF
jgi:hypothetical protein